MMKKANKKFGRFIDTLVDELITMPDDQILEGLAPAVVQAEGGRLLQAARVQAGRANLAAAKASDSATKVRPACVTPEEARQFLARTANDNRYILAARSLGDISDDEALKLYNKLQSLELDAGGPSKR